jgi:hypothetical protein
MLAIFSVVPAFAEQPSNPIITVQRGGFYDACFVASVDQVRESAPVIAVRLAIDHRANAGKCGCKSATLKVLVFAQVEAPTSSERVIGGFRHVQTTLPFSNNLLTYEFAMKKRRSEAVQHYRVWLACGS